ncbi:MAG TPA: GtrA family protein [Xanthobacteraceae bacterium]|nr:GtrA family protein [Xanthobacteraceae bacterium]
MWLPAPLEALSRRAFAEPGRRAVARKAVTFALVGVVNAAVDFGVFSFFFYLVGFSAIPFGIIISNLISWLVAVTGSYVMNSMITFAAESGRKLRLRAYASFLLAQVGGLIANTATIFIVKYSILGLLHLLEGPDAPLRLAGHDIDPVLIGKFLAIGASFLVNFSLSHFVVFRSHGRSAMH